ncbi:MAG: hypothetical protein ACLQIB_53230, partial [Isosphaeraceae bacterium]
YRHAPIVDPNRKRCPVCNESVYSLAGIHPQCAVRQADPPKPKGKAKGAPPSPVATTATDEPRAVALSPSGVRIAAADRRSV